MGDEEKEEGLRYPITTRRVLCERVELSECMRVQGMHLYALCSGRRGTKEHCLRHKLIFLRSSFSRT